MRFAADAPDHSGGPTSASAGGQKPRSAAQNDPKNDTKISQSRPEHAQQRGADRVPEDMASLAIDNPGLMPGQVAVRNSGSFESKFESGSRAKNSADENATGQTGPTERTDADIMLAVAAGDEAGYTYLVGKYHRQIIHFLYRMVHNEAVAEELAQEVFLRVYRSRESYRAEAKFSTWLYRIATNLAVNHARDTKNERTAQTLELDAPDAESGSMPEVADDDPNVEQRMLREERMAAIRAHVAALPERQRMAVLMHKYQEMDYRQIGEVLKLSESATKSLLFRAYQSLRESLKEFV